MLEDVSSKGAYVVIVSDSLEIMFFGINTIFFTFAMMILTVYKRPLPIDWPMVAALSALFGICMSHCGLVTTDRYSTLGSLDHMPTGQEMSGLLRGADGLLRTASFLSQLLMIHRCWAVWDRAWSVVSAPAVMAIAAYACAMNGPARIPTTAFRSPFVAPRNLPFDMAFCILSLAVYTTVTTLIIYRLRRLTAPVRSFRSVEGLIFSLGKSIIEAGALLVLAQLLILIFLYLENPALLIVESLAAQLYGIAPTVMILRLGFNVLPEGRVRWASTMAEFSTVVAGTTFETDSELGAADIELDLATAHAHSSMDRPASISSRTRAKAQLAGPSSRPH
ncbi:hypothetical protein C2E23DRAFT_885623 [Lenzites betulinus]|nr:hypothetical protein C2E23DRAFT_885623 [Lenzites betulinus]